MTGWLIALGIILGVCILPVGALVVYDASGLEAKLTVGPFRFLLYPRPRKEKKQKNKPEKGESGQKLSTEQEHSQAPPPGAPANPNPKPKEKNGGRLKDFLPLVEVALDLLGSLRRKLRVKVLQLRLTMAADDPCDLAINYGRAQAAGAALMAQLERLFVIKKRDVKIQCDFTADEMTVLARLELTITVGRLLALAAVYGIRAFTTFLNIRKQQEGGA